MIPPTSHGPITFEMLEAGYRDAMPSTHEPTGAIVRGDVLNQLSRTAQYDPEQAYWVTLQGIFRSEPT